jgi:hypothetical protein
LQGDVIDTSEEVQSTSQQQTTEFVSEVEEVRENLSLPPSYLMSLTDEQSSLAGFLSRPHVIFTQEWAEGTSLIPTISLFYPWYLYLNRSTIKNKLEHYYLLRANLHLKLIVNASPFYYGAGLLSYAPMSNMEAAVVGGTGSTAYNVGYSQRPHINFYPQSNQGGEMILPFFWPEEWLNITEAANATDMGRCRLSSYGDLLNANGASGGSITIQVFAWLEDVQLSGPTGKAAMQGKKVKDEYSYNPISKPASAIARASGMLSDLPVVGSFFTATSYAAEGVSKVASLFGFTNVPVIDDVHSFKNQPMPHIATTDIGVPSEKLTLDSKNELTIDPRVVGVNSDDELLIKNFCSREAFIFDATWDLTDAPDYQLFHMDVCPLLKRVVSGTNEEFYHHSPMGHAAGLFKYWRGDIKVRIKVICSQYHRGRMIVTWDPSRQMPTASSDRHFSKVIDIAENTDIEIIVPYIQNTAYLPLETVTNSRQGWNNTGTAPPSSTNLGANGVLAAFVSTYLTAPVTTAPVKILVYLSAGENFELAAPRDIPRTISPYRVQGDAVTYSQVNENTHQLGGVQTMTDENINLVYHGESVKSLRTLYRRAAFYNIIARGDTGLTDLYTYYQIMISRRPLYPGYDVNGINQAIGLTSGGTQAYNWVRWTPMTWLDQCFVGTKGSVRWIINTNMTPQGSTVIASRAVVGDYLTTTRYAWQRASYTNVNQIARAGGINTHIAGIGGCSVTDLSDMTTVDTMVPMYSRYKFLEASPVYRTLGLVDVDSTTDALNVYVSNRPIANATDTPIVANFFVAAGTDYTPVFFLNVPTMIVYSATPSPP